MKKLQQTLQNIKPVSAALDQEIQRKLDNLTKPPGSLGRLEELAKNLCRIQGKLLTGLPRKAVIVFAADHGVVAEGVSAYPQEVTGQMLANFAAGGAAINVLARHAGAEVVVINVGVKGDAPRVGVQIPTEDGHPHVAHPLLRHKKIADGTANMARGAAMTREQAVASLEAGIEAVEEFGKVDLLGLGEMGIGNTTAATAVLAGLSGEPVEKITGRGTGVNDEGLKKKIEAIERALKTNKPDPRDALDVLQKVGGFEIGAIAGAILAAAARRIPVAVDGLISTAGALIAAGLSPAARDVMISSHQSVEPGHQKMLGLLDKKAYLDMNMRLGEGTGAVLLMLLADASLKILNEMATFDSAGISGKEKK